MQVYQMILKYQALKEKLENKRMPSTIDVNDVLKDLDNLDPFESYIPEVPQYVADWYEDNKDDLETNLFRIVFNMPKISENKELSLFEEWLTDINTNSFQILINMHQFGYKIKKEYRYLVRMIGLDKDESYLKYNIKSDFWYLGTNEKYNNTRVKHTIKELEDNGFKEVFPSPLFEIIEVKE